MNFDAQRLYELLPAIYRVRDAQQGEPLKALLSVIAGQIAVIEEDLDQLYDDQFIETCAGWVVPYLGDLVGARGIFTFPNAPFSQRAQVANTIAYRRRKGTATVLEQLARDVTGWNATVVEYFQRLATTQYLNHLRPRNLSFTSLRHGVTIQLNQKIEPGRFSKQTIHLPNWEVLEYLTTPFDATARTVDVRRIESRCGKHNIPHVGIHLWRIESFPVAASPAFRLDARRYRFDPLGRDLPLFNHVETETDIAQLAEPINVPMPLSRRVLSHKLERFYGTDASGKERSLLVEVDPHSPPAPATLDEVRVCDLRDLVDAAGHVVGWAHMPTDKIAIDPVLGRLALPADASQVRVNYHYGFVTRIGGGTYARANTFSLDPAQVRLVRVPDDQATIQAALNELAPTGGIVEIQNGDAYFETLSVALADGATIELRAADAQRPVLFLNSAMTVTGGPDSRFIMNGLWIAGGDIQVPDLTGNALRRFTLRHCTLSPAGTPSPADASPPAELSPVRLLAEAPNLVMEMDHSIVGLLRVAEEVEATVTDSLVDAGSPTALAYAGLTAAEHGGPLTLRNATIIGRVRVDVMRMASNTLFFALSNPGEPPVAARRLQEGCVRFSYVPPGSRVPRQFQCQPALALATRAAELGLTAATDLSPSQRNQVVARVKPVFTTLRFGDPAYGQLSLSTPIEIRHGADDESEMGVYHHLYQPQREVNLRTRLDEYLRFGLEAGMFYAT